MLKADLRLHSWMTMRTTIDRIGKYELRAVLARTPLSTVYDGWDSDIARRVAVKLMPLSSVDGSEADEAFTRFKRGARAAGQLNHPNIVSVYDYGETDDYAYLVMEFVNGPTLKDLFDRNERFALADICRIIGSVLDALQYSHDRGVVHRDVKPANIMFTSDHQVKITDFGIARLEDSEMTQAGMVIGTPAYMSPEQFLGEKIDWRTDIYSTGVVLYHILTGERPYEGNLATIMHKVLYGSPLLPSRVSTVVSSALDAIVTRAMARNREDRFNSAAEFNAALQAILTERQGVVPGATGLSPGPAWPAGVRSPAVATRKVAIFAIITTVLLAGGVAGWLGLFSPASKPASGPAKPDQAQLQQEQQARLQQQQEQARLQQQQDQARQQQEQQTRLQQEQEQTRLQQEQDARVQQQQEQTRLQQEQNARLQQQQEQARLQQERDARLQQEQQEQARLKQQEQARLQLLREQARQKLEQDRQNQTLDLARQKREAEQGRPRIAQEQPRPKQPPDQVRPAQEAEKPPTGNSLPNVYPVTSTSGAAGLVCESITPESAGRYGLDSPEGMAVTGVLAGGAAEKAGIRERDVILKIKGVAANDVSVLSRLAADNPSGQTVAVDIVRRGEHKTVQLLLNQGSH